MNGTADKAKKKQKGKAKGADVRESAKPSVNPPKTDGPGVVPYVHRLDLTGRCSGSTTLTRTPIDLSAILADNHALRALCEDLMQPFHPSRVEMVVAVHKEASDDTDPHPFTAAIAGALAGKYCLALGQVSVRSSKLRRDAEGTTPVRTPRSRKRARGLNTSLSGASESDALKSPTHPTLSMKARCQRVVSSRHDESGLHVEYRRDMLPTNGAAGKRVLLISDWIDNASSLIAARDVLMAAGADVVGISFVVATGAHLIEEFMRREIPFSYSWVPATGAQLTINSNSGRESSRCQCELVNDYHSEKKLNGSGSHSRSPKFQYNSSQYEANLPSEDRSINAVKPSEPAIRIHAVFDGHGGSIAVEHLQTTLCNEIFARVSVSSTQESVVDALKESFTACDDKLKTFLEAQPADIRMSKGYCNTGSCAVVALIINRKLYVANVGDCGAVIGRRNQFTDEISARELSTEHSCRNANEVKLVLQRSRDRNAIRLSKDDQETENTFGVKRVAGSLAVTRAFGDFYLKCEELSSPPFKSKVPYITVEPSVSVHDLNEDSSEEQVLILASDGLWEVVGSEEAVNVVTLYDTQQAVLFTSSSAALVHLALEKIAHRDGMLLHELLALRRGRDRRRFHDDITCTVVRILSPRPRLASIETVEETDATRVTDEEGSQSPRV